MRRPPPPPPPPPRPPPPPPPPPPTSGLTVTDVQNCEEDNDATGAQKAGRYHINEVVE